MYENVRSRVKHNNTLSEDFSCFLGIRQGESLSPFLFSMYLNDIEEHFILNGFEGIDLDMFKCRTCLNCLEDEFEFFSWMSVVPCIKKKKTILLEKIGYAQIYWTYKNRK